MSPFWFWVVIFSRWIFRRHQLDIDYLQTEIQILKEVAGKKRIPLNDDWRRRLAIKGKPWVSRDCARPKA